MIDSSIHLSKVRNKDQSKKFTAGVTLPEMIAALAISSIIILIVGNGIVNMTSMNQKSEKESKYLFQLNQTLEYLSNDVRESKAVTTTAPIDWTPSTSPGYTSIIFLEKPFNIRTKLADNPSTSLDNFVAYYTKPTTIDDPSTSLDNDWKSDYVLYRWFHDGSNYIATPILDGLSTNPANCGSGPGISGNNGFRVKVSGINRTKIQLCLQTKATNSGTPFSQSATVAIRNN